MFNVDYLIFLKKNKNCKSKFPFINKMPELNYDLNLMTENNTDQKISFPLEIQGNLQNAMNKFVEQHPNWDQYNLIQAAIAGFLIQKGFHNRELTRIYLGKNIIKEI